MKNLRQIGLILLTMVTTAIIAKEYHVSVNGNDENAGSSAAPFKTISAAIQFAYPGDIITVHEGVYREWVNPIRGGESDDKRIVFRANFISSTVFIPPFTLMHR